MSTPREVFTRLLTGITERRFDELADLYAQDCVVEAPFARPAPQRFEGRAAMREHFTGTATERGRRSAMSAHNVVVHETTDPEVIVAEWDYRIDVPALGTEFTLANIQVLRVRDGRIVSSRDFHDHAAIGTALG